MNIYPEHIRRCQHIKVNGTQCGSPALRQQKYCYFHQEHRERTVRINAHRRRTVQEISLPVLEDANSIQVGVMQVLRLLLGGQIEHKTAGLALYALQIASSNLARTAFEVSRPTKVVVDRKKVAETPLGMTPWSAGEGGHDFEDDKKHDGDENDDGTNTLAKILLCALGRPFPGDAEFKRAREEEEARDAGFPNYQAYQEYLEKEERSNAEPEEEEDADGGGAGVSIQACVDERWVQ